MSYKTVEVELENGRVRPWGAETLPAHAHALLTILTSENIEKPATGNGTLAERVADLAGIGHGDRRDLSVNKAHLDGFGR